MKTSSLLFLLLLASAAGCGSTGASTNTPDAGPEADAGEGPDAGNPPDGGGPGVNGWPDATNTGVPPGTKLQPYGDSCTITQAGTVIDSKIINCDLSIHAANVLIKNSKITGLVVLDTDLPGADQWSYTLQDSEVNGGTVQRAAVSDGNMTVLRCNIYGGETAVHCGEKAVSCVVHDSWLHGQYLPDDEPWHLGGFQSNGGTNIEIKHNNIVCDHAPNPLGEGCTGDLNLIPDFAVVSHVTVDSNWFGANVGASYCTYGGEKSTSPYPHADHVVYTNNVFERGTNSKCGAYGPVTGFNAQGTGNQWTNNKWSDGPEVPPED